ncbi:Uncharacterized protein TPAR_05815 [Tolypocladium paradoxum]|uniref:Uncharacterized protein n=1 Tax=Tolypocladium paradoxum TaxID=94208 RepID=A0A2S4KUW0_9HYPO|nr:Uncharacterized protein TPAR_05815 [Tolypocladium paradoxum]
MPHKHKRKRGEDPDHDLPPTQKARPLPVSSSNKGAKRDPQAATRKQRKRRNNDDDVPRAFKRLMAVAQGKKVQSGLDDGEKAKAKGKAAAPEDAPEAPRIRPGEDLRSFAARVDAALPMAGLAKKTKAKDGKDEIGLKVQRTRKERKMHKLYDQWREEERKIQEKREEGLELEAERDLENDAAGILSSSAFKGDMDEASGKKKGRRRRGKATDDDEDPWLELKRKRAEAKVGLHDVAQAPPELHKKLRQQLRVGDAAVDVDNIPKSAGSLRRREELQAVRDDVVEAYRKIREHEQAKLDAQRERKWLVASWPYDETAHSPEAMAWELEGLIAHLLMLISCAGEHGCSVQELLGAISDSSASLGSSSRNAQDDQPDRAASTIWKWLVERYDVSVGRGREYNHLALHELLALPQFNSLANNVSHGTDDGDAKKAQNPPDEDSTGAAPSQDDAIKVYALEATMWEAITGHAPDYKRVPRSEWLLLLGIASSKSNGILQGDLGRLVDQDKRSVPKRTDALVKKGYIAKRTTLVRGTKTSKMWLKSFTPHLPKENDSTARPGPEMNLSRQTLAENLDPVPWHTSWTGVDIDYAAIATTIMAITKEWEVIRMQDLKAKLGILGMRWQMKILAKACRFLSSRGAVQYVAAKLDNRVFKDCLRFNRDLNAEDWSIYLSTGKRSGKSAKGDHMTAGEEDDEDRQPSTQQANKARLIACAPWTMDKPLPHSIAKMVQAFGDSGLSNPGIYSLTLGATFNRFLSAMTGSMSTSGIQPAHLQHLQLRSEHVRAGKVASYLFFTPQAPMPAALHKQSEETMPKTEGTPACGSETLYGFAPAIAVPPVTDMPVSLTDICGLRLSQKRVAKKLERRGRPKKGAARPSDAIPSVDPETDAAERLEPGVPNQEPDLEQGPSLVVALKVRPEALLRALASDGSSPAALSQGTPPRRRTISNFKSPEQAPQGDVAVEGRSEADPEGDAVAPSAISTRGGRGRGRGRGRRRGAGRGGGGKPPTPRGAESSASRPWTCEKCGGSWKNDIGLKYHLEKSQTTCNPSYSAPNLPRGQKRKRAAFFRPRDSSLSDKDDSRSPQGHASPNPDRNAGAVYGRSSPSTDRLSQTEQPVSGKQRQVEEVSPLAKENAFKTASPRAVKSWKRPTTTTLEEPEPAPFSPQQSNQGLLLPNEASLPRQLSAFKIRSCSDNPAATSLDKKSGSDLERSIEEVGEPKADHEASQAESQGRLAQEETPGPSLLNGGVQASADGSNRKRRFKPDKATCGRICNTIEGMLKEQNGALLGGESLWRAIMSGWNTAFPVAPVPTEKDCQWAVNSLLKKKLVTEHWHAFRDNKGMFAKFQLITRPGLDAFSPESLRLIEKAKDEPFQAMVPTEGEASDHSPSPNKAMRIRGRRLLAKGVAVLDAPVYAAQLAAKRAADTADDGTRRTKRLKYSMKPIIRDTDDLSPSPRRRRGAKVRFASHRVDDGYSDDDQVAALATKRTAVTIRFLEPNTHLDDGHPHVHPDAASSPSDVESPPSEEEQIHQGDLPAVVACRDTDAFVPATPIFGLNGTWPWFDHQQLDRLGTSFTLSGWIPDRRWFSWSAITDEIDKRYAAHGRRCSVPVISPHQRFVNRLLACMDVERSWGTAFAYALPGDAGPHNIFVRFLMEPGSHHSNPLPDLLWSPEEQVTPASAKSAIAELDDDSSSSSMDDGLDPPPHVDVMMARTTSRLAQLPGITNTRQPKIKRVALVTRALTALPTPGEIKGEHPADIDNPAEVLAAFIAVRSLLGGADKAIDWGLLMKLFPKIELVNLRRFWTDARKEQGAYVTSFTRVFQERLIGAYENDELPLIDFDKPLEYDWGKLIRWTMQLPSQEGFQMPRLRESLNRQYTLEGAKVATEDSREKYFHVLTSIFSRFEAVTSDPGVVRIGGASTAASEKPIINNLIVAKSWIKSLCTTEETRYTVEQIKSKFLELSPNNKHQRSALIREALAQLTQQRVICRSKRPFLGGRPYRLNEWYVSALARMAQVPKYDEAAAFKAQLDAVFRNHEAMRVPYTFSDGAMMALTNLHATGRIQLVPVDVPNIPFGFEPGNYESRKYPKSYYYFELEVVPTAAYQYNEEIDVLRSVVANGLPSGGPRGELPQWFDFFGERNVQRWSEILGAFCFAFATRGSMTVEGICSALSPVLDEFEAHLIVDWGKRTGVLTDLVDGMGIAVGEWWWLAVPWLRRATSAAASGAGSSRGKRL